jgi:predicted TIM-barrel fold metal-dependent hydrolase
MTNGADEVKVIDARVRLPADLRPTPDLAEGRYERYAEVLGLDEKLTRTRAQLEDELDEGGVTHAVIHAEYEYGDVADDLNEAVAAMVADGGGRYTGVGTVSVDSPFPGRMVGQARRCAELGLRGVNVQPAFFGRAIDDPELWPLYSVAEESGLVVGLHTGVNYERAAPIDGEQPWRLDRVAAAFPDLALCACHAGWPWADELAAVARRHPTVTFDFGGLAPRYLGEPDTGWSVLMRFVDSLLAEQALYATDWPVMSHEARSPNGPSSI